jgi:hypothetical protein
MAMKTMTADVSVASVNDVATRVKSRKPKLEHRLLHALAFLTFLAAGSIWYLASFGFLRRGEQGADSPISMARSAADTIPFVFQGH